MKVDPTKTTSELISALTYLIDIEKEKELFHAWRVASVSGQIAANTVSPPELKNIFYAALLEDIGAVEFSRHIIYYLKSDNKNNRNLLLSHPIIGAQITGYIPKMARVSELILNHHEWVNGKGYPRARTEKTISLGSQMLRIADAIDIHLQATPILKIGNLKDRMSLNINKEYTSKLFNRAMDRLKQGNFFSKIRSHKELPKTFKQIRNRIGLIHIPLRIDAVGRTLEVIAQIIDMKHPYTSGHSLRVSRYAMSCALALNLKHDSITQIRWAGLIHDIGKIIVSRRILDKPARLSRREFQEVKKHVIFSNKIMRMIPTLKYLTGAISAHHERLDGKGYPFGLKGNKIPLAARILNICDSFDAMTSLRPYRAPFTPEGACRELKRAAGSQFDPEIVKLTLPIFRNLCL